VVERISSVAGNLATKTSEAPTDFIKTEEWLVKLQVEGKEQETQYVLRKGPERWGVLELVKPE